MEPWLTTAARRHPDGLALVTSAGSLTYAELHHRAGDAAAALEVRAGDRLALALPPGEEFVVALHAAWLRGAVVAPIDLRLAPAERAQRIGEAPVLEAVRCCTRSRGGTPNSPGPDEPAPTGRLVSLDDAAALLHTSGTTAAPKPVTLTLRNFLASALGSAVALGLDAERERWLCPMPPVHVGGLSVLVRSAIYATTAVLHERFDTERVLAELTDADRGVTLVSLVPTMLSRLLDAGLRRPPTLRWALLGGGPIPPTLLARAAAAGVPVAPTYGMTEGCSQIATAGWPLPGVELRLAADGEILVRGETVAPGSLAQDGWLHTGDLGRFDGEGRLEIVGRKADTIVSGGENVSPSEVEAALLEHPDVADAGVFARPDEQWGETVQATVVLRPGARAGAVELRSHCAERLASFKVPKAIGFADSLPRTDSGKLLRRQLTTAPV